MKLVDQSLMFFAVVFFTDRDLGHRGLVCQNSGRRKGLGEHTNTSYPTAYTPVVMHG